MRGVSKRIVLVAGIAAIVATTVIQPALAASKSPEAAGNFRSFISKIIRALDEIQIRFPPA
jgi:hypothetical protein